MALSREEVLKVARLSRLSIPEDQVEAYGAALSAILGYVERLRGLNLEGVEPLTHIGEAVNRLDEDVPGPTLPTAVLMKMAPQTMEPFVKVPKVIEEGGGA
jgi:aspartyl-tRNA(Asn)/glutamyl-tRNA(Gln) amidotransferase subunit C